LTWYFGGSRQFHFCKNSQKQDHSNILVLKAGDLAFKIYSREGDYSTDCSTVQYSTVLYCTVLYCTTGRQPPNSFFGRVGKYQENPGCSFLLAEGEAGSFLSSRMCARSCFPFFAIRAPPETNFAPRVGPNSLPFPCPPCPMYQSTIFRPFQDILAQPPPQGASLR